MGYVPDFENDIFISYTHIDNQPFTDGQKGWIDRYINSEWCIRELQKFYQTAKENQGITLSNKARIFKVLKLPVEREKHPPELQGMLSYEFFLLNSDTLKAIEFEPESRFSTYEKFKEKLNDLAYDIQRLLDDIKNRHAGKQKQTNGLCIYLAETTSDLTEGRDRIKRELQAQGNTVLPDTELPVRSADKFKEKVRTDLQRCKHSIHMIGTY